MAHFTPNTDKEYPCVRCGSTSANIVREGPDPRIKCNACQMTYAASDSLKAKEAGALPSGPPKLQEQPDRGIKNEVVDDTPRPDRHDSGRVDTKAQEKKIPRTPTFVFITKNRQEIEFCTKKDLKKTTLRWEMGAAYDVFQLTPKKIEAKVSIE